MSSIAQSVTYGLHHFAKDTLAGVVGFTLGSLIGPNTAIAFGTVGITAGVLESFVQRKVNLLDFVKLNQQIEELKKDPIKSPEKENKLQELKKRSSFLERITLLTGFAIGVLSYLAFPVVKAALRITASHLPNTLLNFGKALSLSPNSTVVMSLAIVAGATHLFVFYKLGFKP